jgi:ADP-ribose pyrophosphatase
MTAKSRPPGGGDALRASEQVGDGGWSRLARRYLFESPWFSVARDRVRLPSGSEIPYSCIEQKGWVLVVPLLADGRVVMERVFRYPTRSTLLECPSGGLDGEAPEVAAARELEEETGYVASRLETKGSFYASSGISNEKFWVVVAHDVELSGVVELEETEQIEVELVPLETLVSLARAGEIKDGPTTLALLLVADRIGGAA